MILMSKYKGQHDEKGLKNLGNARKKTFFFT